MKNKNLFILLIILAAAVLRFLWIDKIPNGISTDEMTYVFNARSIFLTGSDITGQWNPLSVFLFQYPPFSTPQAELPYFILLPFVGLLNFSLFSVRIPFVLASIGSVYLIYLITKQLFNEKAALFASFIAAINPWQIYIGRSSYEAGLMTFLFLLVFYLILVLKNKNIYISIPVLFLAFYSYIGTKASFIPFVGAILLFSYFRNGKKFAKEYLIVFGVCAILVLMFGLTILGSKASRVDSLINVNSQSVSDKVGELRVITLINPFQQVLENKYSVTAQIIITKFINSISFDYLFVNGDGFFSNLRSGFFYVFDFFFLIAGFLFIFKKYKKEFILLVSLLLIGILPHLVYRDEIYNFSPHVSLMFAILIIFVGLGASEFLSFLKNRSQKMIAAVLIVLLYGVSLFNFLNTYFYQFPIAGYFDFSERIVARYATLAKEKGIGVQVFSPHSGDAFKKYVFYSQSMNKQNMNQLKDDISKDKLKLNNVNYLGCDSQIIPSDSKSPILWDYICGNIQTEEKHIAIPRLLDGGESFRIYNDKVCSRFSLKPFPTGLKISDFDVENMPARQFCETFITSL